MRELGSFQQAEGDLMDLTFHTSTVARDCNISVGEDVTAPLHSFISLSLGINLKLNLN